jgi:hypothetical protein
MSEIRREPESEPIPDTKQTEEEKNLKHMKASDVLSMAGDEKRIEKAIKVRTNDILQNEYEEKNKEKKKYKNIGAFKAVVNKKIKELNGLFENDKDKDFIKFDKDTFCYLLNQGYELDNLKIKKGREEISIGKVGEEPVEMTLKDVKNLFLNANFDVQDWGLRDSKSELKEIIRVGKERWKNKNSKETKQVVKGAVEKTPEEAPFANREYSFNPSGKEPEGSLKLDEQLELREDDKMWLPETDAPLSLDEPLVLEQKKPEADLTEEERKNRLKLSQEEIEALLKEPESTADVSQAESQTKDEKKEDGKIAEPTPKPYTDIRATYHGKSVSQKEPEPENKSVEELIKKMDSLTREFAVSRDVTPESQKRERIQKDRRIWGKILLKEEKNWQKK